MKKPLRVLALFLSILVLQVFIAPGGLAAQSVNKNITILFTHDLHDHELPYNVQSGGNITQVGGYARLKTAIDLEKQTDANALLLDAGDYSMGSLFQTVYSSDSPELRFLGQMGYDVTTFGNHEFDFRAEGLAQSLNAAKSSGDKLPQIVSSNMVFPKDKAADNSLADLKKAMEIYGVQDYTVLQRYGLKIGIFGLMGSDAASDAPTSGVQFSDAVESAKRVVNVLKNKEKVDLIVCLSHSGTWADTSKSEDEVLAKKVPEINVIVSGHTHTTLAKPIVVGNTIIGSCGCYGQYLGVIHITQGSSGSWKLSSYNLDQIDNRYSEDSGITDSINKFEDIVQEKYLNKFNLKFNQVVASSSFNFTDISKLEDRHAEDTLGDLISDAYIYAVKQAEGSSYQPVAAAVVPAGTIRGSFCKGNITVADAFAAASLGIGRDNISGYPLITVYLTGKELKTLCEVDASVSPLMPDAQLYMSGLNFTFNPNRLLLNKVTDVHLNDASSELAGSESKIALPDDSKLYRVVANLYSGQMLSKVSSKSYGILSIVPKTKDGTKITDFNSQIIMQDNKELKEWQSVAEYLQSFNKTDGISQIPAYYSSTHARKVVESSTGIIAFFSNPSTFALAVYAIIIVLVALIVFVIVRLATRKKRKEKRNMKKLNGGKTI